MKSTAYRSISRSTRWWNLGANIGLTSLWLARRYGISRIVAVEPSSPNARLTRLNLFSNEVPAEVIEAAVGPNDGMASFETSADSNQGHLGKGGTDVVVLSMPTLLAWLPGDALVDLMKMDIEGGEQALLTGDLGWLSRVRSIVAEFHPDRVDYPGLVKRIQESGFKYFPSNSAGFENMDSFIRQD